MDKITVIGDMGSGKTCFLYAMYHYLSYAFVRGFTIGCVKPDVYTSQPDYDKESELEDMYDILSDKSKGEDRFPLRDDQKHVFAFSLKYRLQEVTTFRWIDYPGGYIRDNGRGSEDFVSDLTSSDSWVIFIDGYKLHHALLEIEEESERNRYITEQVFGRYIRCMDNNANIIPSFISIIVTKSDLLLKPLIGKFYEDLRNLTPTERVSTAQVMARQHITSIIKENIFDNIDVSRHQLSISFVTLGDKIAENNYTGELEPINIEFPITISILSILEKKYNNVSRSINTKKEEIEKIRQSTFANKNRRIKLQEEIDMVLLPKLTFWRSVAKAILERLQDDVVLWNRGIDREIGLRNYFQQIFGLQ